jgi:hypothetical protein
MTFGEVPESCMHDKGFGISILDEEETLSEVFQILDNLENGRIEDSLPRTSAEDVAFDMDEVISIEEDDYYTDGTTSTTSDSDNDSEGSLGDDVEDFEQ